MTNRPAHDDDSIAVQPENSTAIDAAAIRMRDLAASFQVPVRFDHEQRAAWCESHPSQDWDFRVWRELARAALGY